MLGGGAWAGFELFNEFRVLKATVMEYQPPDITGIEQDIAVIQENLVSVSESVELAKDYTRTIKNDLKDDLARQETLMDRLENKVNASQDEIDKTIDEITYKQIKQVKLWEKTHPNYLEDDKLLMEWQTMIRNMTGGTDNHHGLEKEKSSIKRELGMSVEVKNELVDKKI